MWISHLVGLTVWLIVVEGREIPQQYYVHETKGPYRFGYRTADQMVEAEGDPSSEMRGKFAYVDNTGDMRGVEYTAGVKGYVPRTMNKEEVESSMLIPTIVQPDEDGKMPTNTRAEPGRNQNKHIPIHNKRGRDVEDIKDSEEEGKRVHANEKDTGNKNKTPDPRSNTGLVEDNERSLEDIVRGKYTYIEEDGLPATIEYEAGPKIGFVVKGFTKESLQHTLVAKNSDATYDKDGLTLRNEQQQPTYPEEGTEESYPEGLVRGLYTFTDEDGIPATVEYEAGPKIGFVVKKFSKGEETLDRKDSRTGTSLNRDSVVVSSSTDREPSEIKLSSINRSIENQAGILSSNPITKVGSSANQEQYEDDDYAEVPSVQTHELSKTHKENPIEQPDVDEKEMPMNGAYRFGFSVKDQSRHEEADSSGNVHGNYTYVDGAGLLTKVEYEAGAKKGFVINRMIHEHKNNPLSKIENKKQASQRAGNIVDSQSKDHYQTKNTKNKEHLEETVNDAYEESQYGSREYVDERNLPIETELNRNNNYPSFPEKDSNVASESIRYLSFAYPESMNLNERSNRYGSKQNEGQLSATHKADVSQNNKYYEPNIGLNPSLYSIYFKGPNDLNKKQEAQTLQNSEAYLLINSAQPIHESRQAYQNTFGPKVDSERIVSNPGFSVYGLPYANQFEPTFNVDLESKRKTEHKGKHHHKRKKMKRPLPMTPDSNVTNIHTPDGSYAFAYRTKDHSREQSIDHKGNVHYRYQINTKRDGNTLVIFSTQVPKNLVALNDDGTIKESDNYPKTSSNRFSGENHVNKPYYDLGDYTSSIQQPILRENPNRKRVVVKRFLRRARFNKLPENPAPLKI